MLATALGIVLALLIALLYGVPVMLAFGVLHAAIPAIPAFGYLASVVLAWGVTVLGTFVLWHPSTLS